MTHDQLMFNLQYEFRDYITKEAKDYIFDYAMISTPEEMAESAKKANEEDENTEEGPSEFADEYENIGASMELTAVVAPRQLVLDMNSICKKAGLKLTKAIPSVSSLKVVFDYYNKKNDIEKYECCLLDIGYKSIRMHIFNERSHHITRELEVGIANVVQAIADDMNVDIHLARTYLLSNHEDCQYSDVCRNAFENISVDLMRVFNFYRFSNPDSNLNDIWLFGGGAAISPLRDIIEETLDMNIHSSGSLFPAMQSDVKMNLLLQAVGATLD